MSGMEGSRLVWYQGACWRWRWTSAVGLPCRAYQVIAMVWQRRPKGTVRSTARGVRLRAWPTPQVLLASWKQVSIVQRWA